jgi:hypothetical protein
MAATKAYTATGFANVQVKFRVAVIDMFCGTKSVSSIALKLAAKMPLHCATLVEVLTVDNDPATQPDVLCEIGKDTSELEERLDSFMQRGFMIVMHMSPPCEEFSIMKTTGKRDIASALRIVEAAIDIAEKYACAWTLENPATGKLWVGDITPTRLPAANQARVDYCSYGNMNLKPTTIAFSTPVPDDFVARRCEGLGRCPACFRNHVTGRACHALTLDDLRSRADRIKIPPQLCSQIVMVLLRMARDARQKMLAVSDATPVDEIVVSNIEEGDVVVLRSKMPSANAIEVSRGVFATVVLIVNDPEWSDVICDVDGAVVGQSVNVRRCAFDDEAGTWSATSGIVMDAVLIEENIAWHGTLSIEDGDSPEGFSLDRDEIVRLCVSKRRVRNHIELEPGSKSARRA